jgi:hypothetical protein
MYGRVRASSTGYRRMCARRARVRARPYQVSRPAVLNMLWRRPSPPRWQGMLRRLRATAAGSGRRCGRAGAPRRAQASRRAGRACRRATCASTPRRPEIVGAGGDGVSACGGATPPEPQGVDGPLHPAGAPPLDPAPAPLVPVPDERRHASSAPVYGTEAPSGGAGARRGHAGPASGTGLCRRVLTGPASGPEGTARRGRFAASGQRRSLAAPLVLKRLRGERSACWSFPPLGPGGSSRCTLPRSVGLSVCLLARRPASLSLRSLTC